LPSIVSGPSPADETTEQSLRQRRPGSPGTPDAAALRAVADQLDHVIAHGEPEQAKALLAILIAELRVNSRNEILPTYRVGAPVVCAPNRSVEPTEVNANHCARLPGGRMSLDDAAK
jgi:hypothetical protein